MPLIAIDAGHAGFGVTPGKRSPAGEYEWDFNNKVVLSVIEHLNKYKSVKIIRLDDPTGKRDVPLNERTNKANKANADILVSVHHNANTGSWGSWTGTETYHYPGSKNGQRLAKLIHPKILKAYGLRDRGIKTANFHVLRESKMPSVLIEGGFMDSTIDIKKLRDDKILKNAGQAIAEGIAEYFNLTKKEVVNVSQSDVNKVSDWAKTSWTKVQNKKSKDGTPIMDGTRPGAPITREQVAVILDRLGLLD